MSLDQVITPEDSRIRRKMSNNREFLAYPIGKGGSVDGLGKNMPKKPVASIFIHAGAGYHSVANEKVHLQACHA